MVPVGAVCDFIIDDAIWAVFKSIAGAYALLYMALIGVAEMASVAQMVRMVSEGVEG